ncbi:hypothetical protein PBRA_006701 [Plasmodiophora brassicae]|nr:hypothetical protein PBRA_006701 [Plasmodiophora brassicae]
MSIDVGKLVRQEKRRLEQLRIRPEPVCRRESTPWRPARHPRHLDTFSTFPHYADPDREYMLPEDYEFVNFFMKKPATVPITVPWRPTSKPKRGLAGLFSRARYISIWDA